MVKITIAYENDVFIKSDYNEKLVEYIKTIPTKTWDPETKQWWIPVAFLKDFISKVQQLGIFFTVKKIERKKDELAGKSFKFKLKPFKHQEDGFNYGISRDKFILGDDPGLGKTKQIIDIAVYKKLVYGYKHVLIVCGIKNLVINWVNEVRLNSDENAHILGTSIKSKGKKKGFYAFGGTKKKIEDLNQIDKLPYFIITNIETLRSSEVTSTLVDLIQKGQIEMVCVDEAHKIKNPDTVQAKGLLKLRPHTRIPMTGTLLMNSPLDLFVPLNWIDVEKHNFYMYKQHYCEFDKLKNMIGFKNMAELSTILNSVMLRRKKDEVLDLPPKICTTRYLEMDEEQESIYEEVRTKLIENIDKIILSNNPLAELIRLRQATGFTGLLSSDVRYSVKYDFVLEEIEDLVASGHKVTIYSQWVEMLKPLYNVLVQEGYNPAMIGGGNDAYEQEIKFKENDTCKVLLGTITSMGVGLTFTNCQYVYFLDSPWTKAVKDQAEDRFHRIGTKGTVSIVTLVCANTIDEQVEEIVEMKGELSKAIVDGEITRASRADIVRTLLNI